MMQFEVMDTVKKCSGEELYSIGIASAETVRSAFQENYKNIKVKRLNQYAGKTE